MLKKSFINKSVKQLFSMNEKGQVNFDIAIQRNANIWDLPRKSLFINSLLEDYPVNPVYASNESDTLSMLDGKQRLTSVFQFMKDEYTLTEMPTIMVGEEETDFNGKKFSELPEDLQQRINDFTIMIYQFDDITEDEIEEVFFRQNNGVPLSTFEMTRCLASKVMPFIVDLTQLPLFKKISLTQKQLTRYVDQEIALQIINILRSKTPNFTTKDLQTYATELVLVDEEKAEIKSIVEYVGEAFAKCSEKLQKRFLKKVHVPVICKTAEKALEKHITVDEFAKWISEFADENRKSGTAYNNACKSSSARKENIKIRMEQSGKSFNIYAKGLEKALLEKELAEKAKENDSEEKLDEVALA